MTPVKSLANEFLTVYNNGNKIEISHKAKILARAIRPNEWQFRSAQNPYAMARALYYSLLECGQLSQPDYNSIIKVIYYCLLKNFLKYNNDATNESSYGDFIGGNELGFIFLNQNGQFIIHRILVGSLCMMPNYAQKALIDQMLLFGGLANEAKEKGYNLTLDASLSKTLDSLLQEAAGFLPTGEDLRKSESDCASMIESITEEIENGFNYEDEDMYL